METSNPSGASPTPSSHNKYHHGAYLNKHVSSVEVGEYVTKNMRSKQVAEVRNSHFTLGYEPTKPNMVSSKLETPDAVIQKWQVAPVSKGHNMPAAKQNFSYTNNGKSLASQTSNKNDYEKITNIEVMGNDKRLELARKLRQSNLPFSKDGSFTTTNEETYNINKATPNQGFTVAERAKIVANVRGSKPNITLGLERPQYTTINTQNMKSPAIGDYNSKAETL